VLFRSDLAKAKIFKVEQEILYKAVEAYTGLIFTNRKLKINQSNISLLDRQVETDQARLERGQITISDLAQSESSLAGAKAPECRKLFISNKSFLPILICFILIFFCIITIKLYNKL
jgi:hypothetical protein